MDKLEEYSDVTTRLVSETVACTPEGWDHGTLTIDCDGTRIHYKLKNEKQPGVAVISESLRGLIDELYVRMCRHGDIWTQAIITFHRERDEIKFSNSFEYGNAATPASTPPARKKWWNLGA